MPESANDLSRATTRLAALALVVFTAVALAAATAGVARAGGGLTIASAPTVTPGATVTEDSATEPTASADRLGQGCFGNVQYWRLPLTAGDDVEIKMREELGAHGFQLVVFAPTTTDRNIANATPVAQGRTAGKALRFRAATTGAYPLLAGPACYDGVDGPFSFVVTVGKATAAVVALPALARVPATGPITATVRTRAGAAIGDSGLKLKLYGTWKDSAAAAPRAHLLASTAPANGSARFNVRFPAKLRGTGVTLSVRSDSPGYAVTGTIRKVTVI